MAMRTGQLHPLFFAEITGADLKSEPVPALRDFVEQAMATYAVCVVRQGQITDEEHLRFARLFGELELPPGYPNRRSKRMAPELFYAGNLDADGRIKPPQPRDRNVATATEIFHTDSSFNAEPSKWSMLRGVECPPPQFGGATMFCDLRAAYDDLSPSMKERVEGLRGIHDFWEGRRHAGLAVDEAMRATMVLPPVTHPLVRGMPYGRNALFIGGHCVRIEGMDEKESDALLGELYDHATQPKYMHRHEWTEGDIVIWDNRCALHAATPLNTYEHRRDMRRATVNEGLSKESAAARPSEMAQVK